MKAFKGFNKDMTCTPNGVKFQYEEGKSYETEIADVCNSGFHACELPLSTFAYYQPSKSVYHEVEQSGEIAKKEDKTASTKIKIGARLSIKDLVKAHIAVVFERAKKEKSATSGNGSSAATSGYKSSAATSGEESSAATENKNAVALACGKNAKAKGVIGSYLALTEWSEDNTELIIARMERVDGKKIKPNVWYKLADGEFVEVED